MPWSPHKRLVWRTDRTETPRPASSTVYYSTDLAGSSTRGSHVGVNVVDLSLGCAVSSSPHFSSKKTHAKHGFDTEGVSKQAKERYLGEHSRKVQHVAATGAGLRSLSASDY
jgi:hypothetical protein